MSLNQKMIPVTFEINTGVPNPGTSIRSGRRKVGKVNSACILTNGRLRIVAEINRSYLGEFYKVNKFCSIHGYIIEATPAKKTK